MFQFPLIGTLSPHPFYRFFSSLEAANEKESRKTSVTVTSRKPSQVSQEELDGKETLSKQYLKEDGGKKVGLINKAGTDGSQAGPKSNIATPVGRSGILGLFIRLFCSAISILFFASITIYYSLAAFRLSFLRQLAFANLKALEKEDEKL